MPLTIYDTYEAAFKNEMTWFKALLLTDLVSIDKEGITVCPPPKAKREFNNYKIKLEALEQYPNNDDQYNNVVKHLQRYVIEYDSTNQGE